MIIANPSPSKDVQQKKNLSKKVECSYLGGLGACLRMSTGELISVEENVRRFFPNHCSSTSPVIFDLQIFLFVLACEGFI